MNQGKLVARVYLKSSKPFTVKAHQVDGEYTLELYDISPTEYKHCKIYNVTKKDNVLFVKKVREVTGKEISHVKETI